MDRLIESSGSQRLIFIGGLTHSGSTLLDILLGRTQNLIGIGEVVPLLTHSTSKLQEHDRLCSCGSAISECIFWSHVSNHCRARSNQSFKDMYLSLLAIFVEVFGQDKIPVDSSKSVRALRLLSSVPGLDITMIHLIRDVRAWLISRKDVETRRRREGNPETTARWQRTPLGRFLVWYYGNRRLIHFAEAQGLRRVQVSYEGLALRTDEVMTRLMEALGTSLIGHPSEQSHVLLGNRMRVSESSPVVRYDYRWLNRSEWHIPSILLPGIMKHNRVWVYESIACTSMVSADTPPARA